MTDTDHGDHQSIGEVLALLQQDFPDVTISKIRFLESQGLIRPERTASGYRKFFDADIDQLRWILRQQRDNFLPLKVIKKMLEDGSDRLDPGVSPQPTLWTQSAEETGGEADEEAGGEGGGVQAVGDEPGVEGQSGAHAVAAAAGSEGDSPVGAGRHPSSRERPRPTVRTVAGKLTNQVTGPVTGEATASEDDMDPAPENGTDAPEESTSARPRHQTPADVVAALQEGPGAAARQPPASRVKRERKAATSAADLSVEALQAETGITPEMLADLERYGLVTSENRGGEAVYGGDAIDIARIAVRYAELGVEARHLRMYKIAAEREAGLVEQLAMPLLKQRNPAARSQAAELADELMTMGSELHAVLLRRELGSDLGR